MDLIKNEMDCIKTQRIKSLTTIKRYLSLLTIGSTIKIYASHEFLGADGHNGINYILLEDTDKRGSMSQMLQMVGTSTYDDHMTIRYCTYSATIREYTLNDIANGKYREIK